MDYCKGYLSKRNQWMDNYPQKGLNFNIWKQFVTNNDTTCSNGIYLEKAQKCYKYKIMKQVCILLKFSKDPEKNTYSWVYTGGCYKNNEPVWYEDAVPDGPKEDFKTV